MCDDYGVDYDPCWMWDERARRAGKSHQCWACGQTIEKGHRHRVTEVAYAGSFSRFRHCLPCAATVDALRKKLGRNDTDLLALNCGQVWDDAPDDVKALAFMSSAEAQHAEFPGG